MGIIRMGVPEDTVLFIKESFAVRHFVETGTFNGHSSSWASNHFAQVDTVEYSRALYDETKGKLGHIGNINFIFGDSRAALKEIVAEATLPILFWLDAHWCSGGSYGEKDQCPLLEELRIINSSPVEHYILIDDARLFEAPPPLPNLTEFYPGLGDLLEVSKGMYLSVFEDVIYILPKSKQKDFSNFLQKKTTEAWVNYGKKQRQESLINRTRYTKTKHLVRTILKIWI